MQIYYKVITGKPRLAAYFSVHYVLIIVFMITQSSFYFTSLVAVLCLVKTSDSPIFHTELAKKTNPVVGHRLIKIITGGNSWQMNKR